MNFVLSVHMKGSCAIAIVAWTGLLGVVIFPLVPLMLRKTRTEEEKQRARRIVYIIIGIILAVIIFKMSYLAAFLIGFAAVLFVERKAYSRKQLIIYTGVVLLLLLTVYIVLGSNSAFVQG
ncbi:hypothetical protein [Salinicoccus cyprini]|nr:hypothetical protein [Salinicoccus cyprini]